MKFEELAFTHNDIRPAFIAFNCDVKVNGNLIKEGKSIILRQGDYVEPVKETIKECD